MRHALSRIATVTIVGIALLAAATAPAQDANPVAPAADVTRFVGTWRYTSSAQHGADVINEAVGEAVAPMNFFIREIAAGRLRGKNPHVSRIDITVTGQRVRVVFDSSRTYEANLDEWRSHTVQGETLDVQFRYRSGSLVQLFRSSGGTRRNVYTLNGERMTLAVTVQSSQLPRDMTYRLVYRR